MAKHAIFRVILCFALAFALLASTRSLYATCLLKEIGGPDTPGNSQFGTDDDDLFICEAPGDALTSWTQGRGGDDTILVFATDSTPRDVDGDGVLSSGDDTITIYPGAEVDDIRGDNDAPPNELPPTSLAVLHGGNDIITVQQGAIADFIYGDFLRSNSNNSTGGDDIIIVAGRSGNIFADYIGSGTGGNDTIIITETGQVDPNNDIYGDWAYSGSSAVINQGGKDSIVVNGRVYGSIFGDGLDSGGNDDILIGKTGTVDEDIEGDDARQDNGNNGQDRIEVLGLVKGDIEGDGSNGDGTGDYITVEINGAVNGDIRGDGVFKVSGNANGGKDRIAVKGKVGSNVVGDDVDGNGGSDSIVIQGGHQFSNTNGIVGGNIMGDFAGGNGANDRIIVTENAQVVGGVYGDNATRSGGNGGKDNIQIDGRVGTSNNPTGIYGDKVAGDGGDDFLHVEKNGFVYGAVIGDDVNGEGGEDLIWIDGTVTKRVVGDFAAGGNKKDQIAIRQGGVVERLVVGDGSGSNNNGGWDTMNIIGGTVNLDFVGDDVGGNGGNDFMAVRMNGVVGRNFIGDDADKNGGNDTMSLINGTVNGDMVGDDVAGNGGDDKMNVLVAGTVKGDLIGDKVGTDKVGGDDSIFVAGKVNGRIYGDHPSKNAFAGVDNIQTSPSAVIGQGIWGDNAKGAGKNDTFKINGKINAGGVRGDVVNGTGGNDIINIYSLGDVKGNVIGDDANGAGGNDTILVASGGKVTGNIWGDFSKNKGGDDKITIAGTVTGNVVGDYHKSGSNANGGDDTIIIETSGLVQGGVFGDDSPGNGGDDRIDIKGKVNGHVLGDKAFGAGGNDIIRIFASATVGGNVCGKNNCNNNPGDNVVFLDESTTPAFDNADTIIIAGKVLGNIVAGNSSGHSDDTVVVVEGAEIGGTVYAGDETDGDSFIYIENIINEEKTVSEVVNSVKEHNGKVTVNGVTYTLDDVESVSGTVGQIACFGMDYRMNKASDGCSARSQSEKDAIKWHQDNPGNDGRLPGLEGCAVYPYGNVLRVYEIINGAEGQLVAEIWGDVLSDGPASNELLGATADGNIALYHLASGELQVECRNLVDGKTQVRVLSDLAGTVTSAFDRS